MSAQARLAALLAEPRLSRVLALLDGDGEEARVVGGAVRNAFLGLPVADLDIATTATPDIVAARAAAAGLRTIPTGVEHGTVTVVADGRSFEVTTLREDIETDGRHARVRFGRDFAADALRRDFTLNALSLSRDGRVHDYAGGLDDLAARRVRFIGEADRRIAEDFLRILRFFRFHAAYAQGPLDGDGFAACVRGRAGMLRLSRERIRAELLKLIVAPGAVAVIDEADGAGFFTLLFAGIAAPARLARVVAIEAAQGGRSDAMLRLAALGVRVVEDAQRLRERLRLSNAESLRLEEAARGLASLRGRGAPTQDETRRLLFEHGRMGALDALALAEADQGEDARRAFALAARFAVETPAPTSPFSGALLLARGAPGGPALGRLLKTLQARWIRAGFPKEPERLAALIDAAMAEGEEASSLRAQRSNPL